MTDALSERTEANREIIRHAFDAWRDGTGAITDVFAPEMVWRIEGRSVAAKEYGDRQQFIDEAQTPFGDRFAASPLRRSRSRRSRPDRSTPTATGRPALLIST